MDEVQAAVLRVKLKYLDDDNRLRQQVAAYYYGNIKNPMVKLPIRLQDVNNVYHLFPVFCERRDELQTYLAEHGVQTLIHYPIPPHKQKCYMEWNTLSLPITEQIAKEELSLPISPCLTKEHVEYIVNLINVFE